MAEIKQEWVGGSGKSGNNWFPENSVKDFGIGAAKPAKKNQLRNNPLKTGAMSLMENRIHGLKI